MKRGNEKWRIKRKRGGEGSECKEGKIKKREMSSRE